ncbi:hypothetical protein QFZ79_004555 [Arthrobacter sp. V4I6]|nr:hypothetical protein [Arthrobacter sp. V4I6]
MFQPHERLKELGSVLMLFVTMSTVASCTAQSAAPAPVNSPAASDSASPQASPAVSASSSPPVSPTVTSVAVGLCGPESALHFDRTAFPASPRIDNKWFPLTPGMQYTTTGTVTSAEGDTERTVVHSVTGLTKVIDGVKTQVLWDRDYADGELVESELAFFAQTESGDVWLFGEYPEEFEGGTFIGAPNTFLSGISGAQAGIAMQTEPRTGTVSYVQAHAPAVGFLDCGAVFKEHEPVCVPTGCYDDVLVIDEHNPLEPQVGHQRKYYSAGTGLVKVTAEGGENQETLDLVKAEKLSDAQLQEINQQALTLDQHAYQVNPDYATTPKAEVATQSSGGK